MNMKNRSDRPHISEDFSGVEVATGMKSPKKRDDFDFNCNLSKHNENVIKNHRVKKISHESFSVSSVIEK